MNVAVFKLDIPIRDTTKLAFQVEVPTTAEFRRGALVMAKSALALDNSPASIFPVLQFIYSFDPSVEIMEKRVYTVVPSGAPQEIPDNSIYIVTLIEPPGQPGATPEPLFIYEVPQT